METKTLTTEQRMQALLVARMIYSIGDGRFPNGRQRGEYGIARRVAAMVLGDHHPGRDELRAAIELDLVTWRDARKVA